MKFKPVVNSQKVASNQKPQNTGKPLTVSWEKTAATVGQLVNIIGIINMPVNSPVPADVWILFNGNRFVKAENAKVQNGQITAQWRVLPFRLGSFTNGTYDVEINYAGLKAKSKDPLRIVIPGGDRNISSFG